MPESATSSNFLEVENNRSSGGGRGCPFDVLRTITTENVAGTRGPRNMSCGTLTVHLPPTFLNIFCSTNAQCEEQLAQNCSDKNSTAMGNMCPDRQLQEDNVVAPPPPTSGFSKIVPWRVPKPDPTGQHHQEHQQIPRSVQCHHAECPLSLTPHPLLAE